MQRVLRFLLVCFLAAAMPLKGMAAVLVQAGGPLRAGGAVQSMPGPLPQGDVLHMASDGHVHRPPQAHQGLHTHQKQAAQQARPPHCEHHAAHADAAGTRHATDASPASSAHKCSACDACAGATPLPAQAPRCVPPEAGPVRYQRLAQGALRFITDGPDRPPRSHRS